MLYIYPIKNILRRKAEFSETEFTELTVLLQGVESFLPLAQGYNDPFGKIQAHKDKDKNKEMALQKEGNERKVHKAECGDRVWLAAQLQGRGEAEGSGLESGESGCHSCKSSLPI